MRLAKLSTILMGGGVVVGLLGVGALMLGVDLSHLSPFLIKVALYKLTFISSARLLAGGAIVGRRALQRRAAQELENDDTRLIR